MPGAQYSDASFDYALAFSILMKLFGNVVIDPPGGYVAPCRTCTLRDAKYLGDATNPGVWAPDPPPFSALQAREFVDCLYARKWVDIRDIHLIRKTERITVTGVVMRGPVERWEGVRDAANRGNEYVAAYLQKEDPTLWGFLSVYCGPPKKDRRNSAADLDYLGITPVLSVEEESLW